MLECVTLLSGEGWRITPTEWVADDAPSMTTSGRGRPRPWWPWLVTAPDPRRDRGALVVADVRASRSFRDGSLSIGWPYGQTRSRPNGRCHRAPQGDGAEGARGTSTCPAHPHATAVSC